MNSSNAVTTTSVTVTPSSTAFSFAAFQRVSETLIVRVGVGLGIFSPIA